MDQDMLDYIAYTLYRAVVKSPEQAEVFALEAILAQFGIDMADADMLQRIHQGLTAQGLTVQPVLQAAYRGQEISLSVINPEIQKYNEEEAFGFPTDDFEFTK